jgi:hypothetical protein
MSVSEGSRSGLRLGGSALAGCEAGYDDPGPDFIPLASTLFLIQLLFSSAFAVRAIRLGVAIVADCTSRALSLENAEHAANKGLASLFDFFAFFRGTVIQRRNNETIRSGDTGRVVL